MWLQGVPKKVTYRMLLEPQFTRSITISRHLHQLNLAEPVSGIFFGRFLLTLSRMKPPKTWPRENMAMQHSMLDFRASAHSESHFFGTPCMFRRVDLMFSEQIFDDTPSEKSQRFHTAWAEASWTKMYHCAWITNHIKDLADNYISALRRDSKHFLNN